MEIKELQEILINFERDNWVAKKDQESVTRHLTQHIGKLMGKLCGVTEKWEHDFEADESVIKNEVVPDLLYYSLSLAANYNVDLEKAFLKRLKVNKKKVEGWKKVGLVPKDASKIW